MRRLACFALLAAIGGCVPKDFTYADCEGSGGGCTTAATATGTGGASVTAGSGGSSQCGDGVVQTELGEQCDLGAADNADDQLLESSIAQLTPGPLGCTRACKYTVQWSRSDIVADQSVFTGVVAVPSGVVAGGFSLSGDTSVVLDPDTVAYSSVRRIQGFDPDGGPLYSVVTNDAGKSSNGVLGMSAASDGSVFFLETFHEVGVDRGAFVELRDQATVTTQYGKTSSEFYSTVIGPTGDGALVLAFDPGGMLLHAIEAGGSDTDLTLGSGAQLGGDKTGGIAGSGMSIAAAWGNRIARLDALGNSLSSVQYSGAQFRGVCVRPDDVTVAVGWYSGGTTEDPIVVWLDPSGTEVGKVILTDSAEVDGANAVACAPDGSIVVVGEEAIGGTGLLTPRSRAWARRFASDRSLVWTRQHESYVVGNAMRTDTDARAVAIDADGYVYVAGREMTSQATASGWLRKYAP